MSDLSTLMQSAPGSASFMMGQNHAQTRESEALKQQELRAIIAAKLQQQQQEQQMQPLLMEKQRLSNQGLQAGLGGISADSQIKGLQAQFTQATQPGHIKSANAVFEGNVQEEQSKLTKRTSEFFFQASQRLRAVPPLERMNTLAADLKANGMDPSQPAVQQWMRMIGSQDANKIPDIMEGLANKIGQVNALQTPAYQQSERANQSRERTSGADNRTQMDIARMREEGQNNRATQRAAGKGTPDFFTSFNKLRKASDRYGALNAEAAKVGEDTPEGQIYSRMAQAIKPQVVEELKARAAPGSANVEALGVETNQPLDIAPPGKSGGAQVKQPTGKTKSGASYTIVPTK